MLLDKLALKGRSRHWLVDAVVGGGATLVAITVAHAALPQPGRVAERPSKPAVAAASTKPPEPTYLIGFAEPVPGRPVISPFGLRKLPWEEGGRLHEGVDIAGDAGEAVRATTDGVVVRTGVDGGYGRFVELQHAEGLKSFYAHLGSVDEAVAVGLAVKAGTTIGKLGDTGVSTGPHLHFEVRDRQERPLNPEYFLSRRFARSEDLPLGKASRVPRTVRVAYVSHIPASKRELMEARAGTKAKGKAKGQTELATLGGEVRLVDGRPRVRMLQIPTVAGLAERKALVAQVAASQHAQMAAEAAASSPPVLASKPPTAAVGDAVDAVGQMRVDEVNAPS